MAETVLRLTDSKSELVYSALPIDDPKVRRPNIERARRLLSWQPSVTLEEGLGKTIAYERTHESHSMTGLRSYSPPAINTVETPPKG
jgi:nucleoside-diphosphate-sugar epimerase